MGEWKRRRSRRTTAVVVAYLLLISVVVFLPMWGAARRQTRNRMLIAGVWRGDTPTVTALLKEGADPNARDLPERSFWQTMLARIHRESPEGKSLTALLLAAKPKEEFDDLLDASDYPAGMPNSLEVMRTLLDHGADPNARDPNGLTALLYAIRWQKRAAARLLLAHRADPNLGDKNHVTPLHIAVYMSDTAAISMLLNSGADVDRQDDISGQTALMLAYSLKRPGCVEALMAAHPNLAVRDRSGKTALNYAHAAIAGDVVNRFR